MPELSMKKLRRHIIVAGAMGKIKVYANGELLTETKAPLAGNQRIDLPHLFKGYVKVEAYKYADGYDECTIHTDEFTGKCQIIRMAQDYRASESAFNAAMEDLEERHTREQNEHDRTPNRYPYRDETRDELLERQKQESKKVRERYA